MKVENFQSEFEKVLNKTNFSKKFKPIQEKAFHQFLDTGLPSKKWEDWRFTKLNKFSKTLYKVSETEHSQITDFNFSKHHISDVSTLTFFNGHYKKEFSDHIPEIEIIDGLIDSKHKEEISSPTNSPFELLNTAFMDSSFNIFTKKNQILEKPIRFLIVRSSEDKLIVSPKINIKLEENSELTLIEHHVGESSNFFINTSTHAQLLDNSKLRHIRIQSNSDSTINFSNIDVNQNQNSQYDFFQFASGPELSRLNIHTKLNGQGAECSLNGLSLSSSSQQLGAHIITNHFSPNCISKQNFKNILQDKSSGIFNGKTIVNIDAQKTDSKQSNKNLLLSKDAIMNSNPQLEIYADDVKCSHGSTTGSLDEEALFYLRSRGLSLDRARNLLVRGFATELFDIIKHESTKSFISDRFENWLKKNAS